MADLRLCSIGACGKAHFGRGYCKKHYNRLVRHGHPLAGRTFEGDPAVFLQQVALPFDGCECLSWPFGQCNGYAAITWHGRNNVKVSRICCEHRNGPPPTPEHEAAHNCGNCWCINPRHLRWATPTENQSDRLVHGTHTRGNRNVGAKLTESDVQRIRVLLALGRMQTQIAAIFGVSNVTINSIAKGRNWGWMLSQEISE